MPPITLTPTTRTGPTRVDQVYQPGILVADFYHRLTDIARHLRDNDIGALVVVDEGKPVGIITERDLVQAIADEVPLDRTIAADYMATDLVTVEPGTDLAAAARLMREGHIRHLPVVAGGPVVGM